MVNRINKNIASGFSVLELILVIAIMGILAFVAIPRWSHNKILVEFEARRVLNDIRFAQAMSMASGQRYRWVRTSSTSYQITNEAGSAVMMPSGGTSLTLTSGVSFGSFTNLPSNLVAFDSRGRPYTTSTYPGTALASSATIPLTGAGQTATITITPTTGYGALS